MTAEEAEPLNLLFKVCHFFSVVQNSDGFTEHVLCGFCLGAVKSDCCQHLSWGILLSQWKSEVNWSAVDLYTFINVKPHYTLPGMDGGTVGFWSSQNSILPPTGQAVESCGASEDLSVGMWHIHHFVEQTCGL